MRKINVLSTFFILVICYLNLPALLIADSAPIVPASGSTVVPVYDTDIILKQETINIYLKRDEFYVEVEYLFVNTGRAKNITMGFPNRLVETAVEPIDNFKAYDAGRELTVYRKDAPSSEEYVEEYYECFDVNFDALESKNIKNTYSSYYGRNYMGTKRYMEYILTTGALWHDDIENILVNIYIEGISAWELEGQKLLVTDYHTYEEEYLSGTIFFPDAIKVDDFCYYMEFKDIEPDFDIKIVMPALINLYAEASSELEAGSSYNYYAENIIDYNPATSWVEGVRGNGIGEYIELHAYVYYGKLEGFYSIEKIGIINGFAENGSLFYSNNRVKVIRLEYEKYVNGRWMEESIIINLQDTMEMQYYYFDEPVIVENFKIIIEDVYPGSKWDDTCIAEFQVFPESME